MKMDTFLVSIRQTRSPVPTGMKSSMPCHFFVWRRQSYFIAYLPFYASYCRANSHVPHSFDHLAVSSPSQAVLWRAWILWVKAYDWNSQTNGDRVNFSCSASQPRDLDDWPRYAHRLWLYVWRGCSRSQYPVNAARLPARGSALGLSLHLLGGDQTRPPSLSWWTQDERGKSINICNVNVRTKAFATSIIRAKQVGACIPSPACAFADVFRLRRVDYKPIQRPCLSWCLVCRDTSAP